MYTIVEGSIVTERTSRLIKPNGEQLTYNTDGPSGVWVLDAHGEMVWARAYWTNGGRVNDAQKWVAEQQVKAEATAARRSLMKRLLTEYRDELRANS